MRVLIINTSERIGGAAVAAGRLMESLKNNGIKAKMLVRDKQTDQISVVGLKRSWLHVWKFMWERIVIWKANRFKKNDLFAVDIANTGTDITYVEAATRSVIPYLQEGNLFVIESTSPVYTTERMAEVIYKERPELKGKIHIAYCPERVLPGNTLYELVHNDRVIGGIDPASTEKAIEFYSAFVQGKLHGTNARTAEMCKLTENSSRDSQIAFANELSMICDKAGINVWELIELANKHPRVNILQPGCGVGGHCIAVDPWFIVSDYPEQAQLIKRARETNDYKADWCANKVLETCQKFVEQNEREPIVACMGLAFKPNIDDLRESPAKYIASRIISESRADVLIIEPNISTHKSFHLTDYREAYEKADIIVWLVRHDVFVALPKEDGKIELDFCGVRR